MPWVSFAEAMTLLGLSEGTLRRRIRDGLITAEAEPREAGSARIRYRVLVPDPPPAATEDAPPESDQPPPTRQDTPGDAIVDALLVRLDTAQAALLAATERAAAAEATAASLREQLERERAEVARLRRPWWRVW